MEKLKMIGIIIVIFAPIILGFIFQVKWFLIVIAEVILIVLWIKISGEGFSGLKF